MRAHAFVFGREAERQGDVEWFERTHLAIEPGLGVGAQPVRPAQSGAKLTHAEPSKPADDVVEPVILEVDPLAYTDLWREPREHPCRPLGRAVLAKQPHVEMPVVGRAFGLTVTRGCRPGFRQVEQAVPVDTLGLA